jgi:hypothetical protein
MRIHYAIGRLMQMKIIIEKRASENLGALRLPADAGGGWR